MAKLSEAFFMIPQALRVIKQHFCARAAVDLGRVTDNVSQSCKRSRYSFSKALGTAKKSGGRSGLHLPP
ncbi:hypothetical protein GOODEAATRI_004067 [Goodea atripinnis]|uniref:Uncharacterized protein n=1 Tax=Goodea atripinnis TaxID=208336 RepID=A0ABV0MP76_9TELE